MSRLFVAARSQYFLASSAPVTAVPLTIAAWVRVNSLAADRSIIGLRDTGGTHDGFTLQIRSAGTFRISARSGGSSSQATTSTPWTIGRWASILGTAASATDRRIYMNGGGEGTDATGKTPTSVDSLGVGADYFAGWTGFHDGEIEYPALWNVVLTRAEINLHARGVFPGFIRPRNLVFLGDTQERSPVLRNISPYFNKSLVLAESGGHILRVDHSPPCAQYPRQRRRIYSLVNAAAAAVGIPTVLMAPMLPPERRAT